MPRTRSRCRIWAVAAMFSMTSWAACSSAQPASAPATADPTSSAPPAAPAPAATAAATPQAGGGNATNKIDMDAIFPPGDGRELVLNNCQNCHTFVPIVVLQMDEAAWTRSSVDHRPRVTGLSDPDFKTLYDYLKAHFNPSHPVPALPQALLDTWTGN